MADTVCPSASVHSAIRRVSRIASRPVSARGREVQLYNSVHGLLAELARGHQRLSEAS
jgi:hypothetical protein